MLIVMAPAKLNLTLEVLGKRPDGYHEVRSVLQAISLCDELRFQLAPDLTFRSDRPDWVPDESLVSRAAALLKKITGYPDGAAVEVVKRIPLLAGLGGDSSDAAAVLCGLSQLWGTDLSQKELVKLAEQLGSDVPFFLYGGTALAEGRGERITPLPPLPRMWVVLAVPSLPRQPGKTARLYASLNAGHYTDGEFTRRLVEDITVGGEVTPAHLFNTFENVAFTPSSELSVYREHVIKLGADNVHLAGSGPALYTLAKDRAKAEELYIRLKQQGLEIYLAETCYLPLAPRGI